MTPLQKRYEGVNLEKTDRQHKKSCMDFIGNVAGENIREEHRN